MTGWLGELPYYDRDGALISAERWGQLHSDRTYIIVSKSHVLLADDVEVEISTVWIGIDHRYGGDGPPLIFETMYFGGPLDSEIHDRYATELQALAGHDQAVAAMRDKARRT